MRNVIICLLLILGCITTKAQQADSTTFKGYLLNKEYNVFMRINFHDQDVVIPGQEVFGEMAGYLCKENTVYCWMITDVNIDRNKAVLEMANDYGSEDLTATLTRENDSIFTLRQQSGSTIKVPNKGKWQKLPTTLSFVIKR